MLLEAEAGGVGVGDVVGGEAGGVVGEAPEAPRMLIQPGLDNQ